MPTLKLKTSAIKCLHDVAVSECMGLDNSMSTKDIRSVLDACKKVDLATFNISDGFVTVNAGNVKKKFPLTTGKMMEKFPNVPLTSKASLS